MLTLKLITEEKDRVIRGLEKKHFPHAAEAVEEVLNVDKVRRQTQTEIHRNIQTGKRSGLPQPIINAEPVISLDIPSG